LIAQAIPYKRRKFTEDVAEGRIKLDHTRVWLRDAMQPDEPAVTVFRKAFVELLFSSEDIPESFIYS
jgi:hypothetical protein